MFQLHRKTSMPAPEDALPGRPEKMRVPERHYVLDTPLEPPFPEGYEAAVVRPRLLLGRRAHVLGARRACTPPPSATPAATRPTPPTRRSAAGAPATPRRCSWCSTPRRSSYDDAAARVLGEPRPDPGHAPGQRRRHPVPLGDLHELRRAARGRAGRRATRYQERLTAAGYGEITTEIADARDLLLRRGLPPAVPREEPQRVLRPRRHRRVLPGGPYEGLRLRQKKRLERRVFPGTRLLNPQKGPGKMKLALPTIIGSAAVTAALLIAGCGGGGSSNATAASAPAATNSSGGAVVGTAKNSSLGTILVDGQGKTLYMFAKDTGSTSTCNGACAAGWPPLTTKGDPQVVRRTVRLGGEDHQAQRRLAAGDLRRPPALLLRGRHGGRRRHRPGRERSSAPSGTCSTARASRSPLRRPRARRRAAAAVAATPTDA